MLSIETSQQRCLRALALFASEFLVLAKYLGPLPGGTPISEIREPCELVDYLLDSSDSASRLEELADALTVLATRIARLISPNDRGQA